MPSGKMHVAVFPSFFSDCFQMPRPIAATIDIAAMRSNLETARRRAPHAKAWAVVKANAYGHGLANGLKAFAAADGMALVEPEAAQTLRDLGWNKRILLIEGCFDGADMELVGRLHLDTLVHCEEQLRMLELARLPEAIHVHLKVNTGMNRLGFRPAAVHAVHQRLRALPWVRDITLVTHFANADDEGNPALPMQTQVARLQSVAAGLDAGLSLANSAASLHHPELGNAWIRPGIMLYGASPDQRSAESYGLLPGMTLSSRIIGLQEVTAGEAVGYGSRFVADRPTRIGVVACGYADGYPRHAPNGTPVLVDGARCALAGRVSMDMITVDLSAASNAGIGSEVTLWGAGLPIDEVAQAAGTIGYELMCALAPRVAVTVRDTE
jgi:alanine racemase